MSMKISAIVLTKNNEDTIEHCLTSIYNLVDEIVVVDTGSNDKTLEIVKKFTSNIYKKAFNNDFASLRNFAISKTTGDWILSIDSDETLTCNDLRGFLESLSPNVMGILIPIYSNVEDSVIRHKLIKIFRKGIQFEGMIHETVTDDILRKGGEIVSTDSIYISHYGYNSTKQVLEKRKRNLKILFKALEKDPHNPKYLFYFLEGIIKGFIKPNDADTDVKEYAFELSDYIIENATNKYIKIELIEMLVSTLLFKNDTDPRLLKYIEMVKDLDEHKYNILSGLFAYSTKDWQKAFDLLSPYYKQIGVLDIPAILIHCCINLYRYSDGLDILYSSPIKSFLAYRYASMCALKLRMYDRARKLASKSLDKNPLDEIATSVINYIDSEMFVDKNYRILIGSPVRQTPGILKRVLDSWVNIDFGHYEPFFVFYDNNDIEESSRLLENFPLPKLILKKKVEIPYIKGKLHHWNELLVEEVANMKNAIIKYALENNFDYLFLIDSDLVVKPQILKVLIVTNKPVISPVFFTTTDTGDEWAQVWLQDQVSCYIKTANLEPTQDFKINYKKKFYSILKNADCPVRVGGLGACTLIKREVLEKGVNFSKIYNVSFFGEDRDFCIKTVAAGYDLWAYASKTPLLEHLYHGY